MQSLIVVCAMLFVAVTPFMARYEAQDIVEWGDDASGIDVAEADTSSDKQT